MAKEPKQANTPKIEYDALTDKLVPNPAAMPDDRVALAGFVGRSTEEGNIRLYVDASFRNYYEISISDVLYNQQLPTTQSPLGGSVVYVKGGAPLRRVQVSTEIEARFLEGPMSSASAMSSAGASFASATRALGVLRKTILCGHSNAPTSCSDLCPRPPYSWAGCPYSWPEDSLCC